MGRLCTCNQNSNQSTIYPNGNLPQKIIANGNRFLNKTEMQQLSKFGNLSLPPKDIETLREFYFQRALMQIRDPYKLYDIPPQEVKLPQSLP